MLYSTMLHTHSNPSYFSLMPYTICKNTTERLWMTALLTNPSLMGFAAVEEEENKIISERHKVLRGGRGRERQTAREKEKEKQRKREKERYNSFHPLILGRWGVSALYAFPCLHKDQCLCAHTDDFDSQAVSAETRPINCKGFKCLMRVLTTNILAGPLWNSTRTKQTQKYLLSLKCTVILQADICVNTGKHNIHIFYCRQP